MSLRRSSYCDRMPSPLGGSKTQNGRFPCKIALRLKKVCYKVCLCENWWLVEPTFSTSNFGSNWPRWSEIADFRSIFARSDSAVAASERKVQLTLIESPLRAFQWAQDEHRTLSLSPQRRLKNAVSKFWISCDNSETVPDKMSVSIDH